MRRVQTAAGGVYAVSTAGKMDFDAADVPAMLTSGIIDDVVLHEMAHAIGFGVLWNTTPLFFDSQNLYTAGSGNYLGASGNSAYTIEVQVAIMLIPLLCLFANSNSTEGAYHDDNTN